MSLALQTWDTIANTHHERPWSGVATYVGDANGGLWVWNDFWDNWEVGVPLGRRRSQPPSHHWARYVRFKRTPHISFQSLWKMPLRPTSLPMFQQTEIVIAMPQVRSFWWAVEKADEGLLQTWGNRTNSSFGQSFGIFWVFGGSFWIVADFTRLDACYLPKLCWTLMFGQHPWSLILHAKWPSDFISLAMLVRLLDMIAAPKKAQLVQDFLPWLFWSLGVVPSLLPGPRKFYKPPFCWRHAQQDLNRRLLWIRDILVMLV